MIKLIAVSLKTWQQHSNIAQGILSLYKFIQQHLDSEYHSKCIKILPILQPGIFVAVIINS
jgi:hypothetical protein